MIRKALSVIAISTLLLSCGDSDPIISQPADEIPVPEGYTLAWSDEFNSSSINTGLWRYELGDGTANGLDAGWGNNELQIYTDDRANSGIERDDELSALYVRAQSDGLGGYTSARMTTKGTLSTRFGRIDIKAKMPQGQGLWPAIWLLGDNIDEIAWPGCGEIDIVEILGHEPSTMYATVHYTNGNNAKDEKAENYRLPTGSFSEAYHLFTLDWTPETLTFSVDGIEIKEIVIEDDMKEFLRSFYLVVNVAVGGNWPGAPDSNTTFPQTMNIDYIRVFDKSGFTAPAAPALDIAEESIGVFVEPNTAQAAIREDFTDLGTVALMIAGGGGEPTATIADVSIDGDSSLGFDFPGGNWGGGFMQLSTAVDLSNYTKLNFSINKTATIVDAEIKLESAATNAAINIANYPSTDLGGGFQAYSIPLTDFSGLDLTRITIPFAFWNPLDDSQNFAAGTVYIDDIYFSE